MRRTVFDLVAIWLLLAVLLADHPARGVAVLARQPHLYRRLRRRRAGRWAHACRSYPSACSPISTPTHCRPLWSTTRASSGRCKPPRHAPGPISWQRSTRRTWSAAQLSLLGDAAVAVAGRALWQVHHPAARHCTRTTAGRHPVHRCPRSISPGLPRVPSAT